MKRFTQHPVLSLFSALAIAVVVVGAAAAEDAVVRVSDQYPDLTGGMLYGAQLTALGEGEILRAGTEVITADMVARKIAELPEENRAEANNFAFFILESMATEAVLKPRILNGREGEPSDEEMQPLLMEYVEKATADAAVAEADITAFYEENKHLFPDTPLEEVKDAIEGHLMEGKKREAFEKHLQDLGRSLPVQLQAEWVDAQVKAMKNNPVDQARAAGKPLLVDFSATWCPPCKQLKPVIESIKTKFADKLTVLVMDVDENKLLSQRYEVSNIPFLLFYDKDGKEQFRNAGFMDEAELVEALKKIGVTE